MGQATRVDNTPHCQAEAPSGPTSGMGAGGGDTTTSARHLVLNVNDGEVPRYVSSQMLRRGNFEVCEAHDGLEALALAQSVHPSLVLLDIKLPDIDGYEVCRRLKADPQTASIPVLLTSATFTTTHRKVEGFESGADSYLAQPFEASELVATIRALIRLRQAEQTAQAAVRLRDEFLQVAAHELKTPLTPILLKLQLLEQQMASEAGFPERKQIRETVSGSLRQLRRLNSLVEGLLDVSRISAGKLTLDLERVELGEVVREVTARFHEQALRIGSRLHIKVDTPLHGEWDRIRLEQVLTNLLSNALKYGNGTDVEVQTGQDGDQAVLTVRDRGIGIDPTVITRLFSRFERGVSNRSYGGLGLGLFISRQIVEALGGSIGVSSDLEQGTVFSVRLPMTPLKSPQDNRAAM